MEYQFYTDVASGLGVHVGGGGGGGEGKLAVGRHRARVVLQQSRWVSVGDAIMVAAEADVVFFELDGPEGRIEFAVAVLTVRVDASHKAHEQHHDRNDDRQNHHIELCPGDHSERSRRGVAGWGCQAGGQGL